MAQVAQGYAGRLPGRRSRAGRDPRAAGEQFPGPGQGLDRTGMSKHEKVMSLSGI
jgi:hypothetical protein